VAPRSSWYSLEPAPRRRPQWRKFFIR
jgi:hypothetical protein